jgi:hypothetical protein
MPEAPAPRGLRRRSIMLTHIERHIASKARYFGPDLGRSLADL